LSTAVVYDLAGGQDGATHDNTLSEAGKRAAEGGGARTWARAGRQCTQGQRDHRLDDDRRREPCNKYHAKHKPSTSQNANLGPL